MKKILAFAVAGVLLMGTGYAAVKLFTTGWGQEVAVTTTTQRFTDFSANMLSVTSDTGSVATVYYLVNCSTSVFNTALTAGDTMVLAPGESFPVYGGERGIVQSICLATTNSTATVRLNGY